MDYQVLITGLVEEAFEDDVFLRWDLAEGGLGGGKVVDKLLGDVGFKRTGRATRGVCFTGYWVPLRGPGMTGNNNVVIPAKAGIQ